MKATTYQTVRRGLATRQAAQPKSPVNKVKKTATKKGRNKSSGMYSGQGAVSQFQTLQPREERFRVY